MRLKPAPLGGPMPLAGLPVGIPSGNIDGLTLHYTPGSYTFTPPVSGWWKFVLWGPGGSAGGQSAGAASGAYSEFTAYVSVNQNVALVVGSRSNGTSTTATFPSSKVVTAGAASGTTPGAASGGDVNLNGSAGGSSGGGSGGAGDGTGGGAAGSGNGSNQGGGGGAPGVLPFRGGDGGQQGIGALWGETPGAGAASGGAGQTQYGGDGMLVAYLVRV